MIHLVGTARSRHRISDSLPLEIQRFCGKLRALQHSSQVQHNEEYVLRVLEDGGLITRQQIDSARSLLNGEPGVIDILVNDGVVSDVDVSRTLAAQAHMDWIDISSMVIPPQIINQIRGEDARRFKVIPVAFGETGLVVAVGNPLDIDTIDSLSFLLQRELELVCTSPQKIRDALIKYYGTADEAADVLQKKIGEDIDLGLEIGDGSEATAVDEADAPIIRLVSMLLIEAHRAGASDIHLEPLDKKFRVRFQDRRRVAGDASATETFAIRHHQPAQNYDRFDEHCRETPATGRSYPGKNQKEANRSSRLNDSHQSWRERGDAAAG